MSRFELFKKWLAKVPTTATAPFCPSEIQGVVAVDPSLSFFKKALIFLGPGLLISVGYMDPGNWATDIEAGSRFGFDLLFVVLFASVAAIVLQYLSMKVGIITGKDLALLCSENSKPFSRYSQWILAEIAIIACDVAEVLGSALAFQLLLGCSLVTGILITAFDMLLVLGLKGQGFRQIEAIILALILTIGVCFFIELYWIGFSWTEVWAGFLPSPQKFSHPEALYISVGIIGATVMPHNLYLHSSIVQTRRIGTSDLDKRQSILFSTIDTVGSLSLAFLVNAGILILAASAFYSHGHRAVTEIDEAYRLLAPIFGSSAASLLFAIALLASGQSSTFTGTIAGQVILEGFLKIKIPCWKRRVLTRGLAIVPALIGALWLGEHSTGKLLVLSQVVLSLQLPFAIFPLIRFAQKKSLMGDYQISKLLSLAAWLLFGLITAANIYLVFNWLS